MEYLQTQENNIWNFKSPLFFHYNLEFINSDLLNDLLRNKISNSLYNDKIAIIIRFHKDFWCIFKQELWKQFPS